MPERRAQRTLVKSPPELWAEISDVSTLARHLGEFGEIRITRTEPETTVVWEGERARGTVELEPAGWGTRVTLTAEVTGQETAMPEPPTAELEPPAGAKPPVAEVEPPAAEAAPPVAEVEPPAAEAEPPAAAPEPPAAPEPLSVVAETPAAQAPAVPDARRRGFFARLFGRRRVEPVAAAEPAAAVVEAPRPAAETAAPVVEAPRPAPEPEPERAAEPVAVAVAPTPPAPEPAPEPEPESAPVATEPALDAERAEAVLVGVLDDLGAAHHRPFSRG